MNIRESIDIVERALAEGLDATLYHAAPSQRAVEIIKDDAILDRFNVMKKAHPPESAPDASWFNNYAGENGRVASRIPHIDTEYGKKMSGVNLTRNIRFALDFEDVVFAIDQTALSKTYRIMPLDHSRVMDHIYDPDNSWSDHDPDSDESLEFVPGPIRNLNRYLLWVYAGDGCLDGNPDAYDFISRHPKFVRFIQR